MAEASKQVSSTHFRVEISGMEDLGRWVRIGRVRLRRETATVYDSGTESPLTITGRELEKRLELERIFDADPRLQKWYSAGEEEKRNGSIIYVDYKGQEVRRENWSEGYVADYDRDEFSVDVDNNKPAKERVYLVVRDFFVP